MDGMRVVVLLSIFGLSFVTATTTDSSSDATTETTDDDDPMLLYRDSMDRIMKRVQEIDAVNFTEPRIHRKIAAMSVFPEYEDMEALARKYFRAKSYEETLWINNEIKILGDTIRQSTVIPVKAKEELVERLIDE